MKINIERNLEVNSWIIKARWLYTFGIGFLGVLTKLMGSFDLPYLLTAILFTFAVLVNLLFGLALSYLKNNKSQNGFWWLSVLQIAYELIIFSAVFYAAGGLSSVTAIFFILPVFLTAMLFGPRGSIFSSIVAGSLIGVVVWAEFNTQTFHHLLRYNVLTYEYERPEIAFVKVVSYFIFYIIVGIYLGFISRLLFKRETMLGQYTDELKHETDLRKKEMEHTKEVKDKSIAIIANLSDPIIVLDEEHRFYLFNPAAKEILGVGIPDLKMKVLTDKQVEADQYGLDGFRQLIKTNFSVKTIPEERIHDLEVEEVKITYQGEEKVYKVITSEVTGDHGEYYGVMKIFYDLTRENRIDKMKSEFLSVAAHQLRTPLSAIKWVIDMVVKGDAGKINKEQNELLTRAYKSNERMIRLVDDLLSASRIEEGRFGFNFKLQNLNEIVNTAVDNVKPIADKKQVTLSFKSKNGKIDSTVDRDRIMMVLENLLENAVKYTPSDGVVQAVLDKKDNLAVVSVKDNGVGIPLDQQEKLFTKFFRAANVIKMETEGTGLGLFIAKNIIEKHGGTINYKSEEGKGTEFIFTIPINN